MSQVKTLKVKGLSTGVYVPPDLYIGIDPGTKTGVAVWDKKSRKLVQVSTLPIHKAFDLVKSLHHQYRIRVRIEDARKRKWYGAKAESKVQGAGSIKRDCAIWEDFLKDQNIDHDFVAPGKAKTKVTVEYFRSITGYTALTSNHGRDAAMLIYGF